MAKFNVYLYYHGCFNTEIEADTEEEALELARSKSAGLSDTDFLHAIEVMEEGNDVECCKN